MNLRKISATALVAASLTLTSVAPVSAQVVPASPTSSSNNGGLILLGLAAIGLIVLATTGSKAPSGGTVTQNGGKTSGSFSLLKF